MDHGSISVAARKYHLPNTDIFDEHRYFNKGSLAKPIKVLGINVGTPICEDIWYEDISKREAVIKGYDLLKRDEQIPKV